ncbi:MAG TPA: hypothetical protein VJJ72_01720 [Candidatus Paceibacterota bacterium]
MRQNNLFIILIILLGLVGGYFYYAQAIVPAISSVPPAPINQNNDSLKQFKTITIGFGILSDKVFSTLSAFGESPVQPGLTGKKDLFAPF